MNYRHAFHAGNFADCMKHALLVWLLRALQRKETPIVVLDTHAGTGLYDLSSEQAQRTGEWREGIGQLLEQPASPALIDYMALVRQLGGPAFYPGSPLLVRELLRPQDRLIACELHEEDQLALRSLLGRETRAAVHRRDGYQAIQALLPPDGIRRGLTLIDPPFEEPDEFGRLTAGIMTARRRFGTGVIAAWYPIKHRAPVRAFHDQLADAGVTDVVTAELLLRPPLDPTRLNGCGLLVVSPPFGFEAAAGAILSAIDSTIGVGQATSSVRRLTAERAGA
ncbi:23S rRNA (adenine(2030)-N(6))-methyltransferase RlmJ [Lichenicola cladoniae]|uniref:Ribosomal RNA large subunit methyltransferase J n=1 Tax=Lichenicola cladoniae TaxID=1484109 RepID=A0A6M8HQG6_9PROT|nr:23S rRNA (adenine(2030)-N(6))-methyltransferase RlmJ [Lichenicola cladoniae]NPD68153.1 23S rRNA (adenine(2030)-N(6))-methyltransferase RlmJ [Acetobacteraceae bacterium]QKE90723.1 23S rRNA (adenine(2030)-N(6))-methyltransferase RlmJ [Lichenicola cladoniae]